VTGYHRALEWNEPPSLAEARYARWTVVRAAGAPALRWEPLARIGDVRLYLSPPGCERDAATLYVEPLVAAKQARRGSGVEVGVDGSVSRAAFFFAGPPPDGAADLQAAPLQPSPLAPWGELAADAALATVGDGRAPVVSVAVIDTSFDNREALGRPAHGALEGPYVVGLPVEAPAKPPLSAAPGHGTAMAGIVLHESPRARVGLFRVPGLLGAVPAYIGPTSLAIAVAAAVEDWKADVVLIAMSDGAWGTPRHLGDVLRAAARAGRGGRGAAIFCSVGDPSRNHSRDGDSAALGADDLASQPWVQAVAATDARGRWYRSYVDYRPDGSAVYNRLGPAVALSAHGEPRCFGPRIAADDSSQATALAAAASARVLAANPGLRLEELRAILALTADVAPVVDGGRGLMAGVFDRRDRAGHSFKVGYGGVNARAGALAARDPIALALLATREVPDPVVPGEVNPALGLAETWDEIARAGSDRPLGRGYLRARGRLSRLYLRSLAVQEALGWLARHTRALVPGEGATAGEREPEAAAWAAPTQDHGALPARILYVVDAVRDALGDGQPEPGDEAVISWLYEIEGALARADGADVARLMSMCLARASTLARRAPGLGETHQGWYEGDVVVDAGDDGRGGQA